MPIAPLPRITALDIPQAYPSAARAPESTWSNIASAGADIGEYRERQALAELSRGAINPQTGQLDLNKFATAIAQSGRDPAKALALLQSERGQDRLERGLTEQTRHNKAIEDAARTGRVPFGWEPDPAVAGGYRPTAGGPHSPEYQERLAQMKQKPREFSLTDITKLSEEGGKFANVAGFGKTFEDRYAPGYMNPTVGAAVNTAGRYLPEGVVGKDVAKSATWWQGYDRYKQVVRNELYGASLQPNEQRDFEKADVNPGMQPSQIRKNLDIQKNIIGNGLKRKANAAIASGYDPVAISKAYGLDLSELGVDASGRRGTVTPAPTTTAPGGNIPPPPPGFVVR